MKFVPLSIPGAFRIDPEPKEDERGFFARTFCRDTFGRHGIDFTPAQCSISVNRARHTLRGMHYQTAPCPEIKLVRCTAGSIWDCLIDLRPDSPTFGQWTAEELSASNRRALLIPELCAHGFLSLTADSEVLYMMSAPFAPECARAVRWDDPAFGITWPAQPEVMSEADRHHADVAKFT
ncbi:MAG TPA: dTDP-4-dehydrorhamnose 3,5-epimerase family protein [Kiritimatiellia bacterium]|nr:dTDP-4-dehydrorhamnose 3,5-epimerase family protein [Kiritimatiellia bacterium]HMO99337.1 dTDP-4-dehydrorhamnose 3,5-epimerase family protein [Kiritimatiellia bacterium]HMP96095.1 dTDP-4-dehydrorhamnose 3,5-epimerase family protein [Kiritimatiellia bacterium]